MARRPKDGGNVIGYAAFKVIEGIAQADDGFGIAFYNQVASEEQCIAVKPPVYHSQKRQEGPGDAGIMRNGIITPPGVELGTGGIRLQQKDKGQVERVDQELLFCMRPDTGK